VELLFEKPDSEFLLRLFTSWDKSRYLFSHFVFMMLGTKLVFETRLSFFLIVLLSLG